MNVSGKEHQWHTNNVLGKQFGAGIVCGLTMLLWTTA